jgi:hypothetical protein
VVEGVVRAELRAPRRARSRAERRAARRARVRAPPPRSPLSRRDARAASRAARRAARRAPAGGAAPAAGHRPPHPRPVRFAPVAAGAPRPLLHRRRPPLRRRSTRAAKSTCEGARRGANQRAEGGGNAPPRPMRRVPPIIGARSSHRSAAPRGARALERHAIRGGRERARGMARMLGRSLAGVDWRPLTRAHAARCSPHRKFPKLGWTCCARGTLPCMPSPPATCVRQPIKRGSGGGAFATLASSG